MIRFLPAAALLMLAACGPHSNGASDAGGSTDAAIPVDAGITCTENLDCPGSMDCNKCTGQCFVFNFACTDNCECAPEGEYCSGGTCYVYMDAGPVILDAGSGDAG